MTSASASIAAALPRVASCFGRGQGLDLCDPCTWPSILSKARFSPLLPRLKFNDQPTPALPNWPFFKSKCQQRLPSQFPLHLAHCTPETTLTHKQTRLSHFITQSTPVLPEFHTYPCSLEAMLSGFTQVAPEAIFSTVFFSNGPSLGPAPARAWQFCPVTNVKVLHMLKTCVMASMCMHLFHTAACQSWHCKIGSTDQPGYVYDKQPNSMPPTQGNQSHSQPRLAKV